MAVYEWVEHVPPARDARTSETVIEEIRRERKPDGLTTVQEAVFSVGRMEIYPALSESLDRGMPRYYLL